MRALACGTSTHELDDEILFVREEILARDQIVGFANTTVTVEYVGVHDLQDKWCGVQCRRNS